MKDLLWFVGSFVAVLFTIIGIMAPVIITIVGFCLLFTPHQSYGFYLFLFGLLGWHFCKPLQFIKSYFKK